MDTQTIVALSLLMGLAALLYTSVGHAGASAYLAAMALFGVPQASMRPTALVLNLLVATLATWRYVRAGQFNAALLLPFVLGAIPAAYLAGGVQVPGAVYRPLVAAALLAASVRLLWPGSGAADGAPAPPAFAVALLCGAAIGALSGLTGTGGGIFLSPLILLFGWEAPRRTSGVAAAFILCVSAAGLAGNLSAVGRLPPELPWFVLAVLAGALVGSQLGIRRLAPKRILQALAVVLIIAAGRLAFT